MWRAEGLPRNYMARGIRGEGPTAVEGMHDNMNNRILHLTALLVFLTITVAFAADSGSRRAENFNREWKFARGAQAGAEAISFNRPHLRAHLPEGRKVDALFELEVDCWRGRRKPRLLLRDLRPARL